MKESSPEQWKTFGKEAEEAKRNAEKYGWSVTSVESPKAMSIKSVLAQYFSYQDASIDEESKKEALDSTQNSEQAKVYAASLLEMIATYSLEELEQHSKNMIEQVSEYLGKIGLEVSPYGKSKSWAMWDMAKQFYFFKNPEIADKNYTLANPLVSKEKYDEIVDRHIGWEIYGAYASGDEAFVANVPAAVRGKVLSYLTKPPKSNNTLSSKELAELGALVRTI